MVWKNHFYLPALDPPLKRRDCGWHTIQLRSGVRREQLTVFSALSITYMFYTSFSV